MSLLPILKYPDPRLRIVSKPVSVVDDGIRTLIDNMFDTMYGAPGIGLAAPQVNSHARVIVIDVSEDRSSPLVFVNPEIEVLDDSTALFDEGCLSVPGSRKSIERPARIRVRALDRDGNPFEIEPVGLLAVCIQHEMDHLEGRLIAD